LIPQRPTTAEFLLEADQVVTQNAPPRTERDSMAAAKKSSKASAKKSPVKVRDLKPAKNPKGGGEVFVKLPARPAR